MTTNIRRAVAATLVGTGLAAGMPARADVKDYEFQLVENDIKQGEAVLAVRLVDKSTGKPVPEAVIFATRLDMEPDGMASMTTPVEPLPSSEPGVYRFRTSLTMEGGWRLSIAAKVQSETGTVENRLILKAVP